MSWMIGHSVFGRESSVGDAHTTQDSPVYTLAGGELRITLLTGALLMATTVAGMLLVADTGLAELGLILFTFEIVGALAFGALLTVGRYLGLRGIGTGSYLTAVAGVAVSVFAYSWFGGIVLTPFPRSLYLRAVAVTGAVTVAITVVAGAYVYSTDENLEHWAKYSGILFLAGIGAVAVGTFFEPVLVVGFVLILLGFLCDLVYEIWMTSNRNRSPVANGLALYIAFAGVFVHVLQIVLRVLARRNA